MAEENGWSDPYRVRFNHHVKTRLEKLARIESRSVPSLIQDLVIENLAKREVDRIFPSIKESIINGTEGKW